MKGTGIEEGVGEIEGVNNMSHCDTNNNSNSVQQYEGEMQLQQLQQQQQGTNANDGEKDSSVTIQKEFEPPITTTRKCPLPLSPDRASSVEKDNTAKRMHEEETNNNNNNSSASMMKKQCLDGDHDNSKTRMSETTSTDNRVTSNNINGTSVCHDESAKPESNGLDNKSADKPQSIDTSSSSSTTTTKEATTKEATTKNTTSDFDQRTSIDYYFDSYAHHGIHEEMLKDSVRTQTYRNAILSNPQIFQNKIVLDVGCGTGILSMFAVQAGAKHVYGIDCSNIIDQAREIISLNGFDESITLIKGKVEEVDLAHIHRNNDKINTTTSSSSSSSVQSSNTTETSQKMDSKPGISMNGQANNHDRLDNDSKQSQTNDKCTNDNNNNNNKKGDEQFVDIIISEWMGYFLLYESMLDTVIYARDKWLIPQNGILLPDKAVMYISAMEDGLVKRERIDFWTNVYGFNMTPLKRIALKEPIVDIVEGKALVTDAVPILNLDLLKCTKQDLSFSSKFELTASRNDYIHGFVAFFECAFTQLHKPIGFSTSPFSKYTHWKQTLFYLDDIITVCEGEHVNGHISCRPNVNNNRDLDIHLNVIVDGVHTKLNKTIAFQLR